MEAMLILNLSDEVLSSASSRVTSRVELCDSLITTLPYRIYTLHSVCSQKDVRWFSCDLDYL